MTIKTTRIKSVQAPKVEALDLSAQLNGRTQKFSLPRKANHFDRHYLVWNSTVYHNDANHTYYSISADGLVLTTYFDQAPSAGPAHTLQLVIDMGGDSTDNAPTMGDLDREVGNEAEARERADEALRTALTTEANERRDVDNKLRADLDAEIATRGDQFGDLDNRMTAEEAARKEKDIDLQGQIDAITAASDVVDVVGSYADLEAYNKKVLTDNDIIKVLRDETRDNGTTFYRYNKGSNIFDYIGVIGPYITIEDADKRYATSRDIDDVYRDMEDINNLLDEIEDIFKALVTGEGANENEY